MKSVRWIALLCGVLWLCAGCAHEPRTKIGLIGYENVGFEKSIQISGEVELCEDGTPNKLIITQFDVMNDRTKHDQYQLEYQRMQHELILGAIDRLVPLVGQIVTYYQQQPAPQPDDGMKPWIEALLAEIRAMREEGDTGGGT